MFSEHKFSLSHYGHQKHSDLDRILRHSHHISGKLYSPVYKTHLTAICDGKINWGSEFPAKPSFVYPVPTSTTAAGIRAMTLIYLNINPFVENDFKS